MQGKKSAINFYKKEYTDKVDAKIKEAEDFVRLLREEISKIQGSIDQDIKNLLSEIKELEKDLINNKQKLQERKEELKRLMPLKMLFGALNIGCQALSFLGPKGAVIGGVINSAAGIAQGLVCQESGQPSMLQIPQSAMDNFNSASAQLSNRDFEAAISQQRKQASTNLALAKLEKELHDAPIPSVSDISLERRVRELDPQRYDNAQRMIQEDQRSRLTPLELRLQRIQGQEIDDRRILAAEERDLANQRSQQVEEAYNDAKSQEAAVKKQENNIKFQKNIARLQAAVNVAQAGMDMYNTYKNDSDRIEQLDQAIKATEAQISQIKQFEQNVQQYFEGPITQMKQDIDQLQDNLKDKSHVALDVKKWQVKQYLGDMKQQMYKMTKGMKVEGEMASTLQKMTDAIETVIGIYDRVQGFQDQALLANYIANIESSNITGIRVNNPKLQEHIDKLDLTISHNLILEQYSAAINAFKQWVFPFANLYMEQFELLPRFAANATVEDVVSIASERLSVLRAKVKAYFISVVDIDQVIHSGAEFYDKKSTDPFYSWSGKNYPISLAALTRGERVSLNAAVSNNSKSAVKFTEIGINLTSDIEEIRNKLEQILDYYKVILKHMGASFYKYNDNVYEVGNSSLEIHYSFEKSNAGIAPADCNKVYQKLTQGDAMLSPYGLWEIQLKKAKRNSPDFSLSIEEIKYIKLQLVGKGYYVDDEAIKYNRLEKAAALKDLKLERYYKLAANYIQGTTHEIEVPRLTSYQDIEDSNQVVIERHSSLTMIAARSAYQRVYSDISSDTEDKDFNF